MVTPLDKQAIKAIEAAIGEAEKHTSGEIRVHLLKSCKGDPMDQAGKIFARLRMHKTQWRNSVLILVALQSRNFVIFGDQGIHEKVGDAFWNETRDRMLSHFRKAQIKEGIISGVLNVGEALKAYFPISQDDKNELANQVTSD